MLHYDLPHGTTIPPLTHRAWRGLGYGCTSGADTDGARSSEYDQVLPRLQAVQGEDKRGGDQWCHRWIRSTRTVAPRRAAVACLVAYGGAEACRDANGRGHRSAWLRRQQQAARWREPRELLEARDGAR